MLRPTEPRQILAMLEQRARKRFGQHFLTRADIVDGMVRGSGVTKGDHVVEIGPGLGILTEALVATGARVTAIELDRDLAAWMREAFPSIALVEGDAMRVDYAALIPEGNAKVVANLPYNVGTALVVELVRQRRTFSSITVMLQREVVERLLASPGHKAYGSLSLHVQARARPILLLHVPPSSFHPPPKVDSAVIRLDLFDGPDVGPAGEDAFERCVRAAFSQRRKTLSNSLGSLYGRDQARAALAVAGVDPVRRAETVSLPEFQRIAAALVDAGAVHGSSADAL